MLLQRRGIQGARVGGSMGGGSCQLSQGPPIGLPTAFTLAISMSNGPYWGMRQWGELGGSGGTIVENWGNGETIGNRCMQVYWYS